MHLYNLSCLSCNIFSYLPARSRGQKGHTGPATLFFTIGSVDAFERNMTSAQRDMGTEPKDFIPIAYVNRISIMFVRSFQFRNNGFLSLPYPLASSYPVSDSTQGFGSISFSLPFYPPPLPLSSFPSPTFSPLLFRMYFYADLFVTVL